MFKVDYSKASDFQPVEPGEYEVIPVNYEMKKAKSGNNMVVFDYEIRSDVDQPCQGQKIMYDNFVVSEKSMWRFQSASKAAGFPDGLDFASYKDWADNFLNKPIRVVTSTRESTNGKKYPQIDRFKESEVKPPAPLEISDDDVPF